jgi:enoyl-CoA hydratase
VTAASIVLEPHDDRLVVRLNRPEAQNAIDLRMVEALHEVCAELESRPCIALIVGTGGTFAAGADIGQLRDRGREDALRGINSTVFDRLHRLPMPTIALVDGYALGGGAELAYACDFRIGTPSARIGNPEPGLGIAAAAGGCWRLGELVGEAVAKEMLLAGRTLTAEEAHDLRLLNDVVEADHLESAGHALADRIARQAPLAVRLTKALFHAPRSAHPLIDDIAQAVLFETEEKRVRMTTFLDRPKKV